MADARGDVPDHRPAGDPEAPRGRRGDRAGPHHRHPRPHADPHLRPGRRAADGPPRRVPAAHRAERAQGRRRRQASTRRSASARRRARAWCASPSRSARSTACARSAARAASPTRRSSRCSELGMVYFAIVGGAAALETTQIEEIEEVAWEELMPECLWKFRVKDFGPLTVGIDAHGNSLYHDVQAARPGEAGGALCPALTTDSSTSRAPRQAAHRGPDARDRQGPRTCATSRGMFDVAGDVSSTSSSSAGARATSRTTSRRRSRSTAPSRRRSSAAARSSRSSTRADRLDEFKPWLAEHSLLARRDLRRHARHPARAQARADRRLRARLHRPLRGRLEGLRRRVRAVPVGEWIKEELEAGAWKVITEAREGGTAGIFRKDGDMRTGPDRRDRARDRRSDDLIFEAPTKSSPGLVRQALRPERQPRQHPARRGDPARDAPPRPARRHAEGGAAWRRAHRLPDLTSRR